MHDPHLLRSACQFTNNTSACNDGLACTSNDVCSYGSVQRPFQLSPAAKLAMHKPASAHVPGISFSKSLLQGETLSKPTSLQFGPDGRLYVAMQSGLIHALHDHP